MPGLDFSTLYLNIGQVFTPGSPINERDLFAGRIEQLEKIIDAVSERCCHAVLFGERGAGKTSLTNIVSWAEKATKMKVLQMECPILSHLTTSDGR
jgi:hypothetical protein